MTLAAPASSQTWSGSGLRAVPFTTVSFQDRIWAPRQRAIKQRTVPILYDRCNDIGMIEALNVDVLPPPLRLPILEWGGTLQMFWDCSLGKWIEAASYALAVERDPEIEARIDHIVERYQAAQRADGYINTYFIRRAPEQRWTNLRDWHELYCIGHLTEAAIAYREATGKGALLEVMRRAIDHVAATFGTKPGQRRGYCGHEEIELALVRLYRYTGERKYLDLARYFIDERGREPHYFDIEARARGADPANYHFHTHEYSQSHKPVREQDKVVGHAVRAMYLYCGMADVAGEIGDAELKAACERLWADLTEKRLYLTGGMGPSQANEGFTSDYDLPNESAYAETCAAVGLVFWAHRMLHLDCDGRYADMMERALYNGALSGLSLSGDRFFYENPLASRGNHHRWEWHPCPCCPANVTRLVGSVGKYTYSVGAHELACHLYAASTANLTVAGSKVRLRQETEYPWDGRVILTFELDRPARFSLRLRIPGWCRSASVAVNDRAAGDASAAYQGYLAIDREWLSGDEVRLDLEMPVERIYAHPAISEDAGQVALQRGPIVYCLEAVDHAVPVERISLPRDAHLTAQLEPDLLGGIAIIAGMGAAPADGGWGEELYRPIAPAEEPCTLRAIPYYAWDHRQPGAMRVWLREA